MWCVFDRYNSKMGSTSDWPPCGAMPTCKTPEIFIIHCPNDDNNNHNDSTKKKNPKDDDIIVQGTPSSRKLASKRRDSSWKRKRAARGIIISPLIRQQRC